MEFSLFTWMGRTIARPSNSDKSEEAPVVGLFEVFDGAFSESYSRSFAGSFKEIDEAEAMGWDTVWVASAHLSPLLLNPHPFVVAAAAASRTKRIKIGTAVHLPDLKVPGVDYIGLPGAGFEYAYRHLPAADPIHTAEQVAMVDQMSEGRFIYGAGGHTRGNPERRAQFYEFLDVMKQVWSEEHFSGFTGQFYDIPAMPPGVALSPKPFQQPHPPILCPIDARESYAPMGRMGYQIAVAGGSAHSHDPFELQEDVANYFRGWKEAGHAGSPNVAVRIPTHVGATKEEAERDKEEILSVARQRRDQAKEHRSIVAPLGTASLETTQDHNLFGTPGEVIDKIHELRKSLHASEIMFEVNWAMTLPREKVLNSMRLLTDQVIPQFK